MSEKFFLLLYKINNFVES